MGLLDDLGSTLKSAALGAVANAAPEFLSKVLGQTDLGGLQGLVQKLQQTGLDQQVQSWLGNGKNMPVSAEQLRDALGNEQVRQIAQQFGLPVDKVLDLLSQHLPEAVDQASPDGQLQEPAAS
jgi:uncharacterized protein YidB (DUF937 family)